MTDAAWETLSNQAVAAAGLVYFLALLVHLVEWAALREPVPRSRGPRESSEIRRRRRRRDRSRRPGRREPASAFLGRLGFLLTCIAVAIHLVALVGRGMAADPNRVPWGNMYEFTLSGTLRGRAAVRRALPQVPARLDGADRRRASC